MEDTSRASHPEPRWQWLVSALIVMCAAEGSPEMLDMAPTLNTQQPQVAQSGGEACSWQVSLVKTFSPVLLPNTLQERNTKKHM